eukprot:2205005-Prymnesium_polylepis.1
MLTATAEDEAATSPNAEWWKLPEDWATENPIFSLRTVFSQLLFHSYNSCENPNWFLRTNID